MSGGVDDTAFVWDVKTHEIKFECKDHKESVVCCGFNLDSTLVSTADMSGLVQVRNTNTGDIVSSYDIDEVQWLTWHNLTPKVLLAGTKTGEFWMWHVTDSSVCKVFPSFHTPTTNGRLLDNGSEILVSYADGSLRTFNLKTQEMIRCFKDNDHNPEIVCLDLSSDDRYIALGCIDSKVKIISRSTFKLLNVLNCSTPAEEKKKIIERDEQRAKEEARRQEEEENMMPDEDDEDENQAIDTHEPLEVEDNFDEPAEEGQSNDNDEIQSGDDDNENDISNRDYIRGELSEAVEAVCFSRDSDYVIAANTCGSTYLWQVVNQKERANIHLDAGVCRALWTIQNHCLLGCLDGTIRVFDVNLICLEILHIHQEQVLDLYYHDGLVSTASDDGTVAIFSYT